jgi:hypothetical protein
MNSILRSRSGSRGDCYAYADIIGRLQQSYTMANSLGQRRTLQVNPSRAKITKCR